jgi:uncharacterized membrane protein YphA (DoxX/SURF4 family)
MHVTQPFLSFWIYRAVRWSLALVFLYAGITKLLAPGSLALLINDYGLVPESWAPAIAVALALSETAAGIGLVFDIRGSAGLTAALLVLFMLILGYGLHMGLDIDCGCFGPDDPEAAVYHGLRPALYRDMAMMLAVCYLHFHRYRRSAPPIRPVDLLSRYFSKKESET